MSAPPPLDPLRLGPAAGAGVAVVGGCGGIGRAVVGALCRSGVAVTVLDQPSALAGPALPDGVEAIAIDAADEAGVAAAFDRLAARGRALDGLVNLVGFMTGRTPLVGMSATDWDELIAGNLRSAFLVARAGLPLLRGGAAPALVNVASGLATRVMPGYSGYASAKAGMIAMTKAIALEEAPVLRANCVAPGAVDTPFLTGGTGRDPRPGSNPTRLDTAAYVKSLPAARMAVAEDVVGPILFLLGPAARYVTGQTLYVNGGGFMP
ncbi:MAG: SDR family oxidoreductase [Alphaproteobacteria bacterium]|nr:SDR family oxidoreductase [Alphaproteobacteria bacterium]